ncbi:spore gernimation protein [Paenibacillus sp. H1-7]|uniref:GerAB/ArcD/ProY family transporter n=1 Tax=Paenibacillus sp. H1-7 TaxID=2282849 RepID=UPI001EF80405|nr:endospore germination permease [Paenibacillus sp. H1-7]ULL14127.1 spore gernimation protein [Paenibacillus sp. H1-7]
MKKYAHNEVTFLQYIFLIHGAQVGVGQLSLPRILAEKGGTDGWIALLIGWAISLTAGLCLIQAAKRYPQGTLLDLMTHCFGKAVGKLTAVIFAMIYIVGAAANMVAAALIIKSWILPNTPLYIILLLFALPSFLIARNGFRILGRYAEFVFFSSLPVMLFLLIPSLEGNWLYLLPLFKDGWGPILTAVQPTAYSFLGFEVAFFFYPFLQKKQWAAAGIVIANTLSLIVFLYITLVCFLYFSPDEITNYNQPTINVLKSIEFRFVERLEIVFLSAYLFAISTTWLPFISCYKYIVGWLLNKQNDSVYVALFLLSLVAFAFAFDPSFSTNEEWIKRISQAGLVYALALPVCLAVYIKLRDHVQRRLGR